AFNPTEQAKIQLSTVVNAFNPWSGINGGNDTNDKLFLLSYADTINTAYGFSSEYDTDDTARMAQGTDYAKSNGLSIYYGNPYFPSSTWWLRSPGYYPNCAGVVNQDGDAGSSMSTYNIDEARFGARPALKIKLTSDIFTPLPESNSVVDYLNGLIYGLDTGITSLDGYISLAAGYEFEYHPTANGFGTGTIVNVVKNSKSVMIIESYTIIIYGDTNGDGNIDSIDAGKIVDYENNAITWNPTTDAALFKAGDLNGDGNIDSLDAGIAVDFQNHKVNINQSTGLAY
ncbi:MAG: DUF6273 domain-containing protein, partial [Eubacteriales bacterium]